MIKTNSKKARENIRHYIMNNFDGDSYTETPPTEWNEIAVFILDTFALEKSCLTKYYLRAMAADEKVFIDWCQGLPTVLDTCYYYNRSAVDDLAAILEESESEKARYNERDAERILTHLIYRELLEGAKRK